MAKRSGESLSGAKVTKKPKFNDHDETLWDDDLDDDCFDEIANKILEKDDTIQATQQNSSVLLSYDSFKPNIPFASTQQYSIPTIPTNSNGFKKPQTITGNEDFKMKLAYLEQKCESKEGEVSILRSQMKKMKSEMVEEKSKKHKEYLENANSKDKEIKAIKGLLDFKDLEIANLKQKILEISKTNLNSSSILGSNKKRKNERISISSPLNKIDDNIVKTTRGLEKDFETTILNEPEYIRPSKDFLKFFDKSTPEIFVTETRVHQFGRNTIPYLHNQMVQEELMLPPGPKLNAHISNKEISLEDIYSDVFSLLQCKIIEINREDKKSIINKLLGVSIGLLKNLLIYLDQLENIYRTEDIEQLDRTFVQKNFKDSENKGDHNSDLDCEIGIRAGKTVIVVAELLPYNLHLQNLLIHHSNEDTVSNLNSIKDLEKKDFYFLLINDVVRRIFSLRKTQVCKTFLNSVASLLLVVSKENFYTNIFSVFTSLFGSILFTRPPKEVLYKMLVVIKYCSKSKKFLDFLCLRPDCRKFTVDKKRKLNYFSEDTCKFTVFVSLLNNAVQDIMDEELSLDIAFNVLSCVDNVFTGNPYWLHDQQKDRCTCLEQLYQLVIDILYWILSQFKKNKCDSSKRRYSLVCKSGIRIFELLFFNSYDNIEKYIDSYSRYKEICRNFSELAEELDLIEETRNMERLCLFEEVPTVSSAKFQLI